MKKLAILLVSLAPATALAQPAKKVEPPSMPAAPPEVKLTVDAFKGNWKFDATITATGMPGMDKPVTAKLTFNCKPVAGKTAALCEAKGKTPMGPIEAVYIVAYDPYSKAVHFIGITNENEVHDHSCKWTGLALACVPYKGGMGPGGDEIIEDLSISFEADKKCSANDSTCLATSKLVTFKSVSKMTTGGATLTFEGKGKR